MLFYLVVTVAGVDLYHICAGRTTLAPHKQGRRSYEYGFAPPRQLHNIPIAVSGSGHTGKQIKQFDAVIHKQEKCTQGAEFSLTSVS